MISAKSLLSEIKTRLARPGALEELVGEALFIAVFMPILYYGVTAVAIPVMVKYAPTSGKLAPVEWWAGVLAILGSMELAFMLGRRVARFGRFTVRITRRLFRGRNAT